MNRNFRRVDAIVTAVMSTRLIEGVQRAELVSAHAMAVRILDRYARVNHAVASEGAGSRDIDAALATFIAFKTECVDSPMSHGMLARLTGMSWQLLKTREAELLCSIEWRLYDGALV